MSEEQYDKLFALLKSFDREFTQRLHGIATSDELIRIKECLDTCTKHIEARKADLAKQDERMRVFVEWACEVSKKTGVPLPDL